MVKIVVLYDTGLSNSFKVSVHLGSQERGPPVSVEFTFSVGVLIIIILTQCYLCD